MRFSLRMAAYRTRRGFTFIEMGAVIVLIALIATGVAMKMSAALPGERERAFRADLSRMALSAREAAIRTGRSAELSMDETGNRVLLTQTDAEGTEQELQAVQLPQGISTRSFEMSGEAVAASQWRLRFYADGTSESGAAAFWDGERREFALVVQGENGRWRVADGGIPAPEEETWQAGEIERRAGG